MEYNLAWRRRASRMFGGDVVPVFEGTDGYDEYMKLFQFSRQGEAKGVVEIEL